MKIRKHIYITAAVLLLSACKNYTDEFMQATFTVGDEDNEIVLMAGVKDGGTSVTTRAVDPDHGNHTPFKSATKMALRIDGTWLGHSPEAISKSTSATITTTKIKDERHNEVTFEGTEKCYWDDYGTADPANMNPNSGNGRDKGLTIHAACVEGESTAPNITSWTAQSWNVGTPSLGVIDQTSGWAKKDLLTSNNITSSADGTYKFDEWMNTSGQSPAPEPSNILIFTHAMTQITVNLTAGEGFPGYETNALSAKFQNAPEVTLLNFNYKGTINVKEKLSTPDASPTTPEIKTWRDKGVAWTTGGQHTSQFTALVFPGNTFSATIADDSPNYTPTSSTDILELKVDGNTFKVTAAQLVKAMNSVGTTGEVSGTLEQGKNYIINVLVNKTKIEVTATIKKWDDVKSEEAKPKINVTATYGYTVSQGVTDVSAFNKNYDLFRSTDKATGYDEDSETDGINPAARYTASSTSWDKTIYWPNHQTHYFFRGVYPQVGTAVSGTTVLANPEAVTTVAGNDVIAVANAAYTADTYPSDLAIAIPRKPDTNETFDETCKETGHTSLAGICATEGTINMNFEYAMSQVEVELRSVTGEAAVHIDENTVVELVNVYNTGNVKLSDGSVTTTGSTGSYTLANVTGDDKKLFRHSAVVPQGLTFTEAGATTNLRFKITVTNDDAVLYADAAEYNAAKGTSIDDDAFAALTDEQKTKTPATTDVYYADVNPILKSGSTSEKVAPNGKWESGVHYKYILTLSKTAIKVTATLKDWVTVTASDNIWF